VKRFHERNIEALVTSAAAILDLDYEFLGCVHSTRTSKIYQLLLLFLPAAICKLDIDCVNDKDYQVVQHSCSANCRYQEDMFHIPSRGCQIHSFLSILVFLSKIFVLFDGRLKGSSQGRV
jgi:hypothetical protein